MSCLLKVTNISLLSQVEEIKSYLEQRRSWLIICFKDGCLSSQSHFPSLLRGDIKGVGVQTIVGFLHRENLVFGFPTHNHPWNGRIDFVVWEVSEVSKYGNFLRLNCICILYTLTLIPVCRYKPLQVILAYSVQIIVGTNIYPWLSSNYFY